MSSQEMGTSLKDPPAAPVDTLGMKTQLSRAEGRQPDGFLPTCPSRTEPKINRRIALLLVMLLTIFAGDREAHAQDTTIAYQGRLAVVGGTPDPADRFDLRLRLYDAATGGNSLDETFAPTVAPDTNGQFTVLVNAGPMWSASFVVQWVELGARRSGTTNDYAPLVPRQRLTAVPKALHARQADVATSLTGLLSTANLPPNVARLDLPQVFTAPPVFSPASGPPFTVGMTTTVQQLSADLLDGLDSSAFWLRDVSGVTESMGPNDPTSMLDLTLGASRALRLQPGVPSPSLIGGSHANTVSSGLSGATIAGGGDDAYPNIVDSDNATIGGGTGNRIETGSVASFIGSGAENSVGPFAFYAAIVGGADNHIRPQGQYSLIGAGVGNLVSTQAYVSVIGGGQANRIEAARSALVGGIGNVIGAGSYEAFLGGGSSNKIEFNAPRSAILGGHNGLVRSNASYATIAGGQGNTIESSAVFATISGGSQHTIGTNGVDGTIAGGSNNAIEHDALGATVSGGNLNRIQAGASSGTIGGGYQNLVQSTGGSGTIPGGQQGRVANHGQMAYASGAFANAGDAQLSFYVLRRTLTTAGTNELFLDGDAATQRMIIPVEGTWAFDILVSARTDVGASAGYRITGVIRNNAGTTSFTGVPTQTILAEDLAAWNVFVEADDTKDALVIKAAAVGTPTAATRWVATVRTTEVVF